MARVILAGTRSFGSAVHDMLRDKHDLAYTVAPEGDVLAAKLSHNRAWWRPNLVIDEIVEASVDLIVCAHSHAFVSARARQATALGAIGYHPSLLPRHRGRDAVKWTIAMGDPVAGGTVYWFNDNVDGGPIAAQEHVLVPPKWNASDLWSKALFPMGLHLLEDVLDDIDAGRLTQIPQDEACATWEPSRDAPPLFRPDLPELGEGPSTHTTHTVPPWRRRL